MIDVFWTAPSTVMISPRPPRPVSYKASSTLPMVKAGLLLVDSMLKHLRALRPWAVRVATAGLWHRGWPTTGDALPLKLGWHSCWGRAPACTRQEGAHQAMFLLGTCSALRQDHVHPAQFSTSLPCASSFTCTPSSKLLESHLGQVGELQRRRGWRELRS